jgi:hypothetical protein
MNFDEHDGHDDPRAYVSTREPRYVGVCPGHEGVGPWGPAMPVVLDPDVIRKRQQIAHDARLALSAAGPNDDVEAEIDAWFQLPLEPSTGAHWQKWAVSELALAALRGVEREFPGLRYHVVVSTQGDERRACVLARHFSASDDRILALDERRFVVATDDIEDVAFLAGYPLRGALSPFVTVLARSKRYGAALYFDWDDDRFYIAETGGAVLRHALWVASAAGYEIVDDDGDIFMMSGTREYVAELRAWIAGGTKALPPSLL